MTRSYLRFGIQLPHDPKDLILRASIFADRNGFDSVFTPDHLVGIGIKNWSSYEAFTLLGAISQVTTKVKLGTCVSDVLRRHPAVVAQFAVTLQDFSNGRAILGLGAGEGMNLIPYGIESERLVSKLEEGLKVIKRLFEEEKVDFAGKYFKLSNAFIMPRRRVPIWVAGNSPRTMELTAIFGDGWIPTAGMGAKKYGENLKKIRELAKKFGREQDIEAGVFAYIVIEESYDEAIKKIELPAKFLALMSPARKQFLSAAGIDVEKLDKLGIPDLFGFTFSEDKVKRAVELAKQIPFDAVKHRFVFGTADDVIQKIEEFSKAGAEHFVFTPLVRHSDYIPTIRRLAEKVLPYFKEVGEV
ncbi:MAG: LLM class flavin-dependent oxidoreductase [Archaeoglobus sp.]|nr:LLM class flavin-dependent oxidoreductase [Archaeoglobus sp.]